MQRLDEAHANQQFLERWRQGETLHVDGITFASGRVVLLSTATVSEHGEPKCVASPLADSTIASVLSRNPDAWVAITPMTATLDWEPEVRICCGEGAMGNEGFIAATSADLRTPIWVLFSTCSNPFTELRRAGADILADAGYDQTWRIPFANPERFTIVNG